MYSLIQNSIPHKGFPISSMFEVGMISERKILLSLHRDVLLHFVNEFGCEVQDLRRKDSIVDSLLADPAIRFEDMLSMLYQDTLKQICREFGIDDSGRKNEALINRILDELPQKRKRKRKPVKHKVDTKLDNDNILKLFHVSDIHIGQMYWSRPAPRDRLKRAVEIAEKEDRVMVISGDITDNAHPEEFRIAKNILSPLLRKGKCLVVPGNHDVALKKGLFFDAEPMVGPMGLTLGPTMILDNLKALWKLFSHWNEKRHEDYLKCLSDGHGNQWDTDYLFPYYRTFGKHFVLIGLDSTEGGALFAGGELGDRQRHALARLLKSEKCKNRVIILLLHHHVYTYEQTIFEEAMFLKDRNELLDCVCGKRVFILHGHKHALFRRVEAGDIKVVGATALVEPAHKAYEGRVYGYRLDLNSAGELKISACPIADKNGFVEEYRRAGREYLNSTKVLVKLLMKKKI